MYPKFSLKDLEGLTKDFALGRQQTTAQVLQFLKHHFVEEEFGVGRVKLEPLLQLPDPILMRVMCKIMSTYSGQFVPLLGSMKDLTWWLRNRRTKNTMANCFFGFMKSNPFQQRGPPDTLWVTR